VNGQRSLLATRELAKRTTYASVGGEVSGMEAHYLSHAQPRRRYRTTSASVLEVTLDMTEALAAVEYTGIESYGFLVALYGNMTSSATYEIWTGSTLTAVSSTPTAAYYSGSLAYWKTIDNDRGRFPRRHSFHEFPAQRTDPWLRYKITESSPNPDGFLELGLLLPVPGYVPAHPIAKKPSAGLAEDVKESRSMSGARRRQIQERERIRDFILQATGPDCLTEMEEEWLGIEETIGMSEELLVIMNLDATARMMNQIVYGMLRSAQNIPIPGAYELAQASISLQEMK